MFSSVSLAVKLTFCGEKELSMREKNFGGFIQKEALVLAPLAKHLECIHTWLLTILVAFNCEHGLWWLFLRAGISIEGSHLYMFLYIVLTEKRGML